MPNGHSTEREERLGELFSTIDGDLGAFADRHGLHLQRRSREDNYRAVTNSYVVEDSGRGGFIPGLGGDGIHRKIEIDPDGNLEEPTFAIRGYAWLDQPELRHLRREELGRWEYDPTNTQALAEILEQGYEPVFQRWSLKDLQEKVPIRPIPAHR